MSATAKERFPMAKRNHGRRYSGLLRYTPAAIATADSPDQVIEDRLRVSSWDEEVDDAENQAGGEEQRAGAEPRTACAEMVRVLTLTVGNQAFSLWGGKTSDRGGDLVGAILFQEVRCAGNLHRPFGSGMRSTIARAIPAGRTTSSAPRTDERRSVPGANASRTRFIGAVLGWSGSVGTSSGNASAPAFDSGVGNGAS